MQELDTLSAVIGAVGGTAVWSLISFQQLRLMQRQIQELNAKLADREKVIVQPTPEEIQRYSRKLKETFSTVSQSTLIITGFLIAFALGIGIAGRNNSSRTDMREFLRVLEDKRSVQQTQTEQFEKQILQLTQAVQELQLRSDSLAFAAASFQDVTDLTRDRISALTNAIERLTQTLKTFEQPK